MDLVLKAENVSKCYGGGNGVAGTRVLDRVSLSVGRGEFISLMGSSGSGKTTLLNLIGGLDTCDEGTIRVDGRELNSMNDDQRSAFRLHRIGFVFQFFNLLPNLTVLENIALPLLFLKRPEKDARRKAAEVAGEVGLGEKTGRLVHQLSGGEMQLVGLARALAHEPSVLLADEPTGNLDSKTGASILDLVRRTATQHHLTVLMATHDTKAADYADRTIRMADGRILDPD